ncbi:MAG: hypothetical protein Q7S56_00210 [Nanoarchaeota archaeon]|nr:hypothetical protein [Nanoarchaeota archaeon]
MVDPKKKKVTLFLTLSFLGLLFLNLAFISSYILLIKYGTLTLNPGEKYIVNIPFIGLSKNPTICGTAEQTDGTPLSNITVRVEYNQSLVRETTTGTDGEYCITLPNMTSSKKFDVYVQYDNVTSDGSPIVLGSNSYTLSFDNNRVYSKSLNKYVLLTGSISNEDARIENGRFEIKVGYKNSTWKYIFGDYEKYSVNVEPDEVYSIPNSELNVSWKIPDDAPTGVYKFLYKTSFNGLEKTSQEIFFNITE